MIYLSLSVNQGDWFWAIEDKYLRRPRTLYRPNLQRIGFQNRPQAEDLFIRFKDYDCPTLSGQNLKKPPKGNRKA